MNINAVWLIPTLIMAIGIGAGYFLRRLLERAQSVSDGQRARLIVENAKAEAEALRREAKVAARDEIVRAREKFEEDTRQTRAGLHAVEERLSLRETNLDRRVALVDRKDTALEQKLHQIESERQALLLREDELQATAAAAEAKLQEVADLSREQAREILLQRIEVELRGETSQLVRKIHEEAKHRAESEAREIITTAIERYAADQVAEVTTTAVSLPSDEMKGRIIGKEGRNIRCLEAETGCNILIDETPETVVVSSFDPVRREVARVALERLVTDGRIQPARIEEVVREVREATDDLIRRAGEEAVAELGLGGVAPELVRTLGSLRYRHSYSQNVLRHSVEMGHLMGMMAADLGLDSTVARRVGLFHDIGKAIDHRVEGAHALIGADLLKRHGEEPAVYNAVAAHHHEVQADNVYASLAAAADAITAARPGARSETTEIFLKRLRQLEQIANSFRGVRNSYAIQAGRELRVFVSPARIDDAETLQMARNISRCIQEQVKYPGQIKVTVIRETRCIEYAR